eukprot:scaffold42158_cov30-Tisochrysis_lutea.AAC.1
MQGCSFGSRVPFVTCLPCGTFGLKETGQWARRVQGTASKRASEGEARKPEVFGTVSADDRRLRRGDCAPPPPVATCVSC